MSPLPGVLIVTGFAFVAYGLVTGKVKLRDVRGARVLLGGIAGFLLAGRMLPGINGVLLGTAILAPAVAYSLRHTRRLLAEAKARAEAREAALIQQARAAEDPALALLAEADIEDAHERRSQAVWRRLRLTLALPIAMATVGALNGGIQAAVFGALVGMIPPVGMMIASRLGAPIIDEKKKLKGAV
jgi:hypothetical protein